MQPADNTGNDEAEMWKNSGEGEDVPLAAKIDRTFVPTLFNDENMDFVVSNP